MNPAKKIPFDFRCLIELVWDISRIHHAYARGNFIMKHQAFTLIELLIVVAIIAILAAIAVPNFLEAQTRSKVSRAKSDMRSIATGVEAWSINFNHYPPDGDDLEPPINPLTAFDVMARLHVITTPVAHMTSLPFDPFHKRFDPNPPLLILFPSRPPYTYSYNTFGAYNQDPINQQPANQGDPDNFTLSSLGPSEAFDSVLGSLEYDPTNGTVSAGDIIRNGGNRVDR
jgi:prepilin-type N-terminal cleavage/methylation domain-containing protein